MHYYVDSSNGSFISQIFVLVFRQSFKYIYSVQPFKFELDHFRNGTEEQCSEENVFDDEDDDIMIFIVKSRLLPSSAVTVTITAKSKFFRLFSLPFHFASKSKPFSSINIHIIHTYMIERTRQILFAPGSSVVLTTE